MHIAGDRIGARGLAEVASEVKGTKFELVRSGSLADLAAFIRADRAADPEGERQVFPRWQGAQYLHNMFAGHAEGVPLDNDRYGRRRWTTARNVIAAG